MATEDQAKIRELKVIHTSYFGIAGNVILTVLKGIVGFMANSIAVILDALNSLTDALSSIITIIGAKLSNRRPDKMHPFGYGRIEYLTSMVISVIILYAGISSLVESIKKIISPADPDYSFVTLAVIIAGIVIKIFMGIYVKGVGKKINSQPLVASGIDALYDVALSAGTLVAALLSMFFNINIDGLIGAIISVVIIKGALDLLREAVNSLIGERMDPEFTNSLKEYISGFDGVNGVYDLAIDSYGPDKKVGSVHIEVNDNMSAKQIHELTRKISNGVYENYQTILTLGVYADNTTGEFAPMKEKLKEILLAYPEVLQMHGFYVDEGIKTCYFDLVIDFKQDSNKVASEILSSLKETYPDFTFEPVLDVNVSDV